MASQLRPALSPGIPPDYRSLTGGPRLYVRHPGYDDRDNTIISFTATDGTSDAPAVQYHLVHTVCAMIAANRYDGWLSSARQSDTGSRIADDVHGRLLPTGEYWFHVPAVFGEQDSLLYPIIPNFREWTFPQNTVTRSAILPDFWTAPPIPRYEHPPDPRSRDIFCRLTGHTETTELAHIIPASEKLWAGRNRMDTYRLGSMSVKEIVDSSENLFLLREDVHTQWDKRMFSIIPKRSGADNHCWAWTLHVNVPSQELHHLYHNRTLHPLSGIQREFLFARLAWDFFPEIHGFLQGMVPRRLQLRDGSISNCSGEMCRRYCEGQGQNRSASPTKRKLADISNLTGNQGRADNDSSFDSAVAFSPSREDSVGSLDGSEQPSRDDEECDGMHSQKDEMGDSVDQDAHGCLRRRRNRMFEARHADPDPFGLKRRAEVCETTWGLEGVESHRGRKRIR